jgi:hypothetical protein
VRGKEEPLYPLSAAYIVAPRSLPERYAGRGLHVRSKLRHGSGRGRAQDPGPREFRERPGEVSLAKCEVSPPKVRDFARGYLLFFGGRHLEGGDGGISDTRPLTRRQIRCLEKLPEDHEVVSMDMEPIVCGPRGEWLRVKVDGRLVPLVESVQSYLDVDG